MSLLLGNGHAEAHRYPVGMVWDEARLVAERLNVLEATRATLLQMAISSMFSQDAGKNFQEQVARLAET